MSAHIGYDLVNFATPSDQAADQSNKSQSAFLSEDDIGIVWVGTNDHKRYKGDRYKHLHFRSFLRRCIANYAMPERKSARDATKAGAWTNSGSATGVHSSATGSKISATVTGRYVSVGYTIQAADITVGSLAKVFADGIFLGSFSCDGYSQSMSTINGAGWGCALATFDTGIEGPHLVEVIQASNGSRVYVDDFRGSNQQTKPKVLVGNIIKMSDSAYTQYATNGANVNVLCGVVRSVVDEFAYIGLNVAMVDVNCAVDPDLDLFDGVHPSNPEGHAKLAKIYEDALASSATQDLLKI